MAVPSVSVVLPVGYGDRYFRLALDCALSQTFPPQEIILLDNSKDSIEHLLPTDSRIKYARTPRTTIGALRNQGNGLASGDVIVHFDEDDFYSADRIAAQVARLSASAKSVTGWHSLFFYNTADGRCYRYSYAGRGPYGCGTSLAYLRSWWAGHPFQALAKGEDYYFQLDAAQAGQLDSCDAGSLCVARGHRDSTCPPSFGRSQFPEISPDALPAEFWLSSRHTARI